MVGVGAQLQSYQTDAQDRWRGVWWGLWLAREEVGSLHAKRLCEAMDDVECWVPAATLDTRDVGAVEVCAVGEVFLRPAVLFPKLAHSGAECGSVIRNGHLSKLALS